MVGAIFSGIGALFIAMTVMRWVFRLEAYITEKQYRYLSYLLIAMTVIWFYFTYTEHLILAAGQQEAEFPVLASKLWGDYAPGFWLMVGLMVVAFWVLVLPRLSPERWGRAAIFQPRIALATSLSTAMAIALAFLPQIQPVTAGLDNVSGRALLLIVAIAFAIATGISLLPWLKRHIVASTVIASFCVVVGMWLERWNIIVPTMAHPRLIPWSGYTPTATEWALTVASFALFAFLFLIIFKLFPPVAVWEVAEGRVIEEVQAQVELPLPESSTPARRRWGIARR